MHPLATVLAVLPVVVACVAMTWHGSRLGSPPRVLAPVRNVMVVPGVGLLSAPPQRMVAPTRRIVTPPATRIAVADPIAFAPGPHVTIWPRAQLRDDTDELTSIRQIPRPGAFPHASETTRIAEHDDEDTQVFIRRDVFNTPTRVVAARPRARR